ncbi:MULTISPECIES: flavin-containing monooxygenase [unclassified Gordonia (in: high G+C Gram-positive bacteria)]|uniref:flavin-containing monooxygenase n=1 Tax=unclassified Gordonia (in: high G+C Gram-positive bacteria) TaxID=2657482 RepID=UPI0007EAC8CA|nr:MULTISPECIES: NAD(P)/FAD-dependent oxidoreductase [unclassified Gordonia (in: high G+C Gram-positive bacteria)]OBC00244.1 FAD-containing monooxygenase EthA [Gordonia sp. 852002-50395_SCH5434458]OBC11124.1 FAD-containing monooxygenase EthA [Gordonia sp. 852002-50816_SCH5313054-a]OBC18039.1 FAD-containing monooxygenase EthA [Gordonia sp. 852002-50816_SCH5313054-c]
MPTTATPVETLDVLIVGAGVSGIGAAHYVTKEMPQKSYALLEGRESIGGTWDLFRYPGIRSDSDLHTFGFEFKPWVDKQSIADADRIMQYLREAVDEDKINQHLRLQHKVTALNWSSSEQLWTAEIDRLDTGEHIQLKASWVYCGSGYYNYDEGFTPHFEGRERFTGQVVHPQHWPEDLDYKGKKVVVIGSGATAVTLLPAMANETEHITMLQRTPTYILPLPKHDPFANVARRILGDERGYAVARWKNILQQRVLYEGAQRFPKTSRKVIRKVNQVLLPDGYDVDTHFNPPYNPWDQRLCAVPDADLFKTIRSGKASVVTDRIKSFTEKGLLLESGTELEADIVVTATGLNVRLFGGMDLSLDDEPVVLRDHVIYRGMMLSGVPNLALAVGYTNSSWTLKIGLIGEYWCRLMAYMDARGYREVAPVVDPNMDTRPALDFGAGYIKRVEDQLPRQGAEEPWKMSMSFYKDRKALGADVADFENLRFKRAASPAGVGSSEGSERVESAVG